MSSNNSSTDSPPSTAGETPATQDNDPSPSATESTLPPPAAIGLEISPGGDEAPATPAQIEEDQDRMEAAIKESMERIERDEDAPVPAAQTAAAQEETESTIRRSTLHTQSEDVPVAPLQITTDMDQAIKESTKDAKGSSSGMDPQDHLTPADFEKMDAVALQRTRERVGRQQEEILQQVRDSTKDAKGSSSGMDRPLPQNPPTPAAARAPSSPPTDQGRSPSNPSGQQQTRIRPPPPSMMPSSDASMMLSSDAPTLEATPVAEAPVYGAVQVAEQTGMTKYKKYIFGGLGVLVGGAVVAVAVTFSRSSSSNNVSSSSHTLEPEGVILSTSPPSHSSSPSEVPSLRPALGPSRSLAPSTSPPPTASPRPSQTPSVRPSSVPTTAPPVYCGEINVLPDEFPWENSWTLVRNETIGGLSYTQVVLEGTQTELRLYTTETCLESGNYEFTIIDGFGDGIQSPGYYSVMFDGVVIAQGGESFLEERVSFSLPLPSPQPSESSSPSKFPSASFQPSESTVPSQSLSPSLQPSKSSSPSTHWSTWSWSRQGLGFNGDAQSDHLGRAVTFSADASTMAIGAPGHENRGDDRPGYVKVYRRVGEGQSWEQRGDTMHGETNGVFFGCSLSLSEDGTTLSVGATNYDDRSGQVKVYKWNEATLNYLQIGDTLYGAASGDRFGHSLDISNGTILAVGAYLSDANATDSGQVTVYAWDGASSNFQQRGGAIDGNAAEDWLGYSISLAENGQKLAIGAPYGGSDSSKSGQVRVFEWDEATSNYKQLGDALLGNAAGDRFGRSVSFSRDGTTLAIGAPSNDENGQTSGLVKVFAWDKATSNFDQMGQSLYGKRFCDSFGSSVALSSEVLAIGAIQFCSGGPGYVDVYAWDNTASEYRQVSQSISGEKDNDRFGLALALAGNGRDLAVGAHYNDRNGTFSGRVEVFDIEL